MAVFVMMVKRIETTTAMAKSLPQFWPVYEKIKIINGGNGNGKGHQYKTLHMLNNIYMKEKIIYSR